MLRLQELWCSYFGARMLWVQMNQSLDTAHEHLQKNQFRQKIWLALHWGVPLFVFQSNITHLVWPVAKSAVDRHFRSESNCHKNSKASNESCNKGNTLVGDFHGDCMPQISLWRPLWIHNLLQSIFKHMFFQSHTQWSCKMCAHRFYTIRIDTNFYRSQCKNQWHFRK